MRPLLLLPLLLLPLSAPVPSLAEAPARRLAPHTPVPQAVITPLTRPARPDTGPLLTRARVDALKATVASAGTALLALGAWLGWRGRKRSLARLRDGLLAGLALVAGLCWWNLLQFHFPGYAHVADDFHYYLGAKYFPELGYTRLYACAAVADGEAGGLPPLAERQLRNLETNVLEGGESLAANPERCTVHFSPERWRAFREDLAWLRAQLSPRRWQQLFTDHGYNGTPAWGVLGTTLTNTGPLTAGQLRWLTALDPVLLLAMWACVGWAFGWRATCVALLFWGTNYAAGFGWTGGGILRQDWLAASVIGLALLRRGRPRAGGFALGLAALLRVFPAVLLGAIALKALMGLARRRSPALSPDHRRIAQGVLLALALWGPASLIVAGSPGVWGDFVVNSRVHLATPLRNHVGLATALAQFSAETPRATRQGSEEDPYAAWKTARREHLEERWPVFAGLVLAYVALLAVAVARQPDWIAAALGIGLVPVAFELTSYYYAILLGLGFLWTRRESIGVGLVGLSALSWAFVEVGHFYEVIFAWTSVAAVAFVTLTTALLARPPSGEDG